VTSQATIRTYFESFIGLDCNGFTGNDWRIDPTMSTGGTVFHAAGPPKLDLSP
jgi:hypothetical protein